MFMRLYIYRFVPPLHFKLVFLEVSSLTVLAAAVKSVVLLDTEIHRQEVVHL